MSKKTESRVPVVGTAVRLAVAGLLAAAVMALVPDRADAQAVDPSIADSDSYVPIYEVCVAPDPVLGELLGGYAPLYDGFGGVQGLIVLNVCAFERLGAGPQDIQYAIAHELGHSRGLLHTDDPSNFMYPVYPITGR